jgi:hypothetical protein
MNHHNAPTLNSSGQSMDRFGIWQSAYAERVASAPHDEPWLKILATEAYHWYFDPAPKAPRFVSLVHFPNCTFSSVRAWAQALRSNIPVVLSSTNHWAGPDAWLESLLCAPDIASKPAVWVFESTDSELLEKDNSANSLIQRWLLTGEWEDHQHLSQLAQALAEVRKLQLCAEQSLEIRGGRVVDAAAYWRFMDDPEALYHSHHPAHPGDSASGAPYFLPHSLAVWLSQADPVEFPTPSHVYAHTTSLNGSKEAAEWIAHAVRRNACPITRHHTRALVLQLPKPSKPTAA